jgi:hypothetical protein
MRIKSWMAGVGCVALIAGAANADAISFTPSDVGKSFTVDYNGFSSGSVISGLTGATTFTLTGTTADSYTFSYAVNNTTSAPVTGSRISGFGFNTDPNISNASATGVFNTAGTGNVPEIGTVDVCFKSGGGTNNCAGGGGGGVALGTSANGSLTLSFASALSSLTLSDFALRYQSITGVDGASSATGIGTIGSTSGGSSSGGPTDVPEPRDFALFGLAALAVLSRGRFKWSRPMVLARA